MKVHFAALIGIAALTAPAVQAQTLKGAPDYAVTTPSLPVTVDVARNDGIGTLKALAVIRPPTRGTAVAVNGQMAYWTRPGFIGRDTLTYIAVGTTGAALQTLTIDSNPAYGISLQGKVTDGPIANAKVAALAGNSAFAATADANGNYTLHMAARPSEIVRLRANGIGRQANVVLTSVVGEMADMQRDAGADRTLTRQENNAVQVTHVSTATARLLSFANGDQPPASKAELDLAQKSLDSARLLRLAAAIKLVVDKGHPLPRGISDTDALLADPARVESFLSSITRQQPSAIDDAIAETLADSNITLPTTPASMLGQHLLMYSFGVTGTVRVGLIQGEQLTLNANGTGTHVLSAPNADPRLVWRAESGGIHADIVSPVALVAYPYVASKGRQVRQLLWTESVAFRRLVEGEFADVFAVTKTTRWSYPDDQDLQGGSHTGSSSMLAVKKAAMAIPYLTAELVGSRRAMRVTGTGIRDEQGQGVHELEFLAAGNGFDRSTSGAFSWSLDAAGQLRIQHANGDVNHYTRLMRDGLAGEGVLMEAHWADGRISTGFGLSAVREALVLNPIGMWRSGYNVSKPDFEKTFGDFRLRYDNASAGMYFSTNPDGTSYSYPFQWSQAPASVFGNVPVVVREGPNVRRWFPVAQRGTRVYVMEELGRVNPGGGVDTFAQRMNFYDRL